MGPGTQALQLNSQSLHILPHLASPSLFGMLGVAPPPVAGKIRSYVACARGMIVSPKVVRGGDVSLTHDTHTHTHMRTHTHTRAHTRKHARTHARTQTQAEREREREREREKLRAQRALKQSDKQYIHTHTKHTNTNKTPFFDFRIILETPKGAGTVGEFRNNFF